MPRATSLARRAPATVTSNHVIEVSFAEASTPNLAFSAAFAAFRRMERFRFSDPYDTTRHTLGLATKAMAARALKAGGSSIADAFNSYVVPFCSDADTDISTTLERLPVANLNELTNAQVSDFGLSRIASSFFGDAVTGASLSGAPWYPAATVAEKEQDAPTKFAVFDGAKQISILFATAELAATEALNSLNHSSPFTHRLSVRPAPAKPSDTDVLVVGRPESDSYYVNANITRATPKVDAAVSGWLVSFLATSR